MNFSLCLAALAAQSSMMSFSIAYSSILFFYDYEV